MTLLVVGGDDDASRTLAQRLDAQGFNVTRAPPGAVRERALRDPPDLVLCAFELAEQLSAELPDLPVAIVSENGLDKASVLAALRLGVIDVIEMAHEPDFAATVEAAIDRARQRVAPLAVIDRDARGAEMKLRELQRDQRAGRYIQLGMLPPTPMAVDDYRLRHRIFPSLMLSGDFVDYFRVGERHFLFYMADVSGHGASSAFVTVLLKNFSRRFRREFRPAMLAAPGEILAWLNRELLDNQIDKHVAMFIGVVDIKQGRLAYANAGHFPPAFIADANGVRTIEMSGKPVGLFRDATWESCSEVLDGDFCLVLVSDGVLEVLDKGTLAQKERQLLEAAGRCYETGADVWQVLDLEARQPCPDDMSCLMVTRG